MKISLNTRSIILFLLSIVIPIGLNAQKPAAFGEFALQELSYGLQSTANSQVFIY